MTDWHENHREVVNFAYWIEAHGFFNGRDDIIRYFENPEDWVYHVGQWIREKYEARATVAL